LDTFALGAARGNLILFNKLLVTLFFGNLTAKVFFECVTFFEIRLLFFNLRTNVIGPGQNFLNNFLKLSSI
tara:strand:+ start:376 stop:588 length:213 start_codon:yes stop_codon:yes gene_type:complete